MILLIDFDFNRLIFRFPDYLSTRAKDLISKLLKHKGEDRLPLKNILQHSWVQQHLTEKVKSKYNSSILWLCNQNLENFIVCFGFSGYPFTRQEHSRAASTFYLFYFFQSNSNIY